MKLAVCVLACALASGAIASAEGQADVPIGYRDGHTVVKIHKGKGPVPLNPTPEITDIDEPLTVSCISVHGCVVIADARVQLTQVGIICVYVDGAPMHPGCATDGDARTLQAQRLKQGIHTIQTTTQNEYEFDNSAGPFTIIYTIHDR